MKTQLYYILIASLFILFATTSCNKKNPETNSYCTITGFVYEEGTDNRISNADVTLSPTGKPGKTNSDGYFEFTNLDNDQYTITVQKSGYITNRKTVSTEAGQTINISIPLEKEN